MAGINQIKISELPTKENPSTNDYLVMDDASETSRIKAKDFINSFYPDFINLFYPVGSIYMSVNDIEPSVLFGGTWEKIKDRFLLASGDTYTTGNSGGAATHTHDIGKMIAALYPNGTYFEYDYDGGDPTTQYTSKYKNIIPNGTTEHNSQIMNGGIPIKGTPTQPSNNMPPYLVVNIWQRIS